MDKNNEIPPQEPTPQGTPAAQGPTGGLKRIPKVVWYMGGGCLALVALAVVILLVYFGPGFFSGRDPIAAVVPNDTLFYTSVDFTNAQSEDFNQILVVFQEIADQEELRTLTEILDDFLAEELDMNVQADVMPWISRFGSLVITTADPETEDYEYMVILQTRDPKKADEFVQKLVAALEDKHDAQIEQTEIEGVTFYTSEADGSGDPLVIARAGKLLYFGNTRDAILSSINLEKNDSLANLDYYKQGISDLPKDRIATFHVSAGEYLEFVSGMMNSPFYSGLPGVDPLTDSGLAALAFSLSVEDVGLRMDAVTLYDETRISEYERQALDATYSAPTTDKLVPADTFFFVAANSSQSPASFLEDGNAVYTEDMQESFDLLEDEFGISIPKLLELLTGEIAIAIGPANDGLMAEMGELNMGLTIIASTNDEAGFNDWFGDFVDLVSDQAGLQIETEDANYGDYELSDVVIPDLGPQTVMVYGADQGYMFVGSSPDMLESGLNNEDTLAANETYRETWKAFPAGSLPYVYVDVGAFVDFVTEISGTDLPSRRTEQGLNKLGVLAATINSAGDYSQTTTMILFIDTEK
jgi:hypothetical protein